MMKKAEIKSVIEVKLYNEKEMINNTLFEISDLQKATKKVYNRLLEDDVNHAEITIHFKKEVKE